MKSKYDPRKKVMEQMKENKSFKFFKLYKSANETKMEFETENWTQMSHNKDEPESRSRSPNKKNKRKKVANISPDSESTDISSPSPAGPRSKNENDTISKSNVDNGDTSVRSIMKNKPRQNDSVDTSNVKTTKPKKRNKSVSFMIEDADEVVVKKSKFGKDDKNLVKIKSKEKHAKILDKPKDDIEQAASEPGLSKKLKFKDTVKSSKSEADTLNNNESEETAIEKTKTKKTKKQKHSTEKDTTVVAGDININKNKKAKKSQETDSTTEEVMTTGNEEKHIKNKKKRKAKTLQDSNIEVEEPVVKARKKELRPETIAEGLENLNIGDNAHTLTTLLDEMTVADKNKKKKDRRERMMNNLKNEELQKLYEKKMRKKNKLRLSENASPEPGNEIDSPGKEKWNRRWNKGGKADHRNDPAVVVENLPISIMCDYKAEIRAHFGKFGAISGVGIAETYPDEDPDPVFSTTVYFRDEVSAERALVDDNTIYEGNRIRVRRLLPPKDTTVVLRVYADMTDQIISSILSSAGRIRQIRHMDKGKNSISTAFVEFDGPEAVERALKLASEAKICGKKVYTAKYEVRSHVPNNLRNKAKKPRKPKKNKKTNETNVISN